MTTINERAPGLLDQSPWSLAHQAEQSERIKQYPRRTPEAQADIAAARAAPTAMEIAMQEVDRAADFAVDELRNAPNAYRSHHDAPPAPVVGLDAALSNAALADTPAVKQWCSKPEHDAGCTPPCPAAPSDTPAVREMGGPARDPLDESAEYDGVKLLELIGADALNRRGEKMGGRRCTTMTRAQYAAVCAWHAAQPAPVVLTGPEAERYRALQDAARKAQQSAITARADGAALLQLFQAFCAGLAPGKEG